MHDSDAISSTDPAAFLADAEALRATLDASPVPMLVVDLTGTVLLRNLAHKRLLAQNGIAATRSSLTTSDIVNLFDEPDRLRAFAARLAAEPDQEHEEELLLPGSGTRLVVRSAPLRGRLGGAVLAHVLVLRDVTADSEEQEWRRAAVLEARTPLTAIRGFAELLTGADVPERTRVEYLQTVAEQCERLAGVLDEIYSGPERPQVN